MIHPNRPLVFLALLPCVVSLALVIDRNLWPLVLLVDAFLISFATADAFSVPSTRRLRAQRECDHILSRGERHQVGLWIENRSRRALTIEVRDEQAPDFDYLPPQMRVNVPARSRARLAYTLIPRERGSYTLQTVYARTTSRLGLWRRIYPMRVVNRLRVYPDFKQISRYALYARLNRLSLLGVRRSRRVGTDNEFERLRDYTPDDNYRFIDWRATARRQELVVRDFESNHSQRVVFLIDAGRMMVNEVAGVSLFDHAIDAMLMLSHVVLSKGDRAGLLTFSDRVHHWIPPAAGKRHLNRFVHAVHDLFPRLVESRFDLAFQRLNEQCRKRTLVILITNVIDDVNGKQVEARLTHLSGRHLPLAVLLRDAKLFAAIEAGREATDETAPADLFRAAAAADLADWREQVLGSLRRKGALTLDVAPDDLTAPLINEYLRIKARHLL